MSPRVGTAPPRAPAEEPRRLQVEILEPERAAELFPEEQAARLSFAERQQMVTEWKRVIRQSGGRRGQVLVLTADRYLSDKVFQGLVRQALDDLGFQGPTRYASLGPNQMAVKLPGRRRGPMPHVS